MQLDTFQTTLPGSPVADRMIAGLKQSAWSAWMPGVGFPEQYGSGYGGLNDQWIPGPVGAYDTHKSLGRQSTRAQEAQKNRNLPPLFITLRKWWRGE